jgi:hypothetical protein
MFVARSIRTSFVRIARPTLLFSASVHYAHPSWKYNRPVEFWCYNKGAADFKLVSLKDLKSELIEGTFEKEFQALSGSDINVNDGPGFSRWFLFPDRDDATAKAILQAFSISLPSRNVDLSSRAKAEFIMGTTRSTDHLLLRVHDLRLQEHENDGDDGEVDDIAWLQVRPSCIKLFYFANEPTLEALSTAYSLPNPNTSSLYLGHQSAHLMH